MTMKSDPSPGPQTDRYETVSTEERSKDPEVRQVCVVEGVVVGPVVTPERGP